MRYLLTGIVALLTLAVFFSCQKEISVEYGSPAQGTLQSTAGDCLPKTVNGTYLSAKVLNDTNYIDVSVNVTTAGPYTIATDTLNGYFFRATGTFATTGVTTVRLKGSGTPALAQTDNFTVNFNSSNCLVDVTVLPAGTGAAVYTLSGAGSTCTSFTSSNNFYKDTTLDTRHYVDVTVNVTVKGTYSITTNTVNGYSFSATGTFANTGSQTVRLMGQGKPLAVGANTFTVTAAGATCTFSLTVTAPATACGGTVQGTYTTGTALASTNKVTLSHTYAAANTYTVKTDTLNGYYFGPQSVSGVAGANSITLTATGTPVASGTNTFTVNFGDGTTCSFTVTAVGPPNTDYFPTTLNSYWTYDDQTGPDTFKVTVTGPIVRGSNTYQKFTYSGVYTGNEYYRKSSSNFYYQSFDTTGWGTNGVSFSQSMYEVLFLKENLSTGANWNSDVAITYQGTPLTLRFADTCTNATGSLTVNGKSFTNVYIIKQWLKVGSSGIFQPADGPYYYYYAKGVGLIYSEDASSGIADVIQRIRYWVVN